MPPRSVFTPRLERLDDRSVPSASGRFAVGAGPLGPPRVQVYDVATGVKLVDFLAFENTFNGGVTTAMGDVNNDGIPDLIVGAGFSGGPRVRVFNGAAIGPGFDPTRQDIVLADFFAFEDSQRGGVFVATGNFIGNGLFDDLVIGAGPGGGPRVRVLDGSAVTAKGPLFTSFQPGDTVADFFAFESTFRNGVTVAANATSAIALGSFSDLVVAPGFGGSPRVRVLNGLNIGGQRQAFTSFGLNDAIADFFSGDPNSRAGLFVATNDFTGDGQAEIVTGTGPGLPALVTVYDGLAVRTQRTNFTGGIPGDRIDTFTPVANYANGVTVGTTTSVPTSASGLLYGTGGAGFVSDFVLAKYVPFSGVFARVAVYDKVFDPALFIGVNVSN